MKAIPAFKPASEATYAINNYLGREHCQNQGRRRQHNNSGLRHSRYNLENTLLAHQVFCNGCQTSKHRRVEVLGTPRDLV